MKLRKSGKRLRRAGKKIINKEFDKFLEENNVYHEYYENRRDTEIFGKGLIKMPAEYIAKAFDWILESEIHDSFWRSLNRAWLNKLSEEYKEKNELIDLI